MALEPRIFFYDTQSTQNVLSSVQFRSAGNPIKAGDTSDNVAINIWNNPYSTSPVNAPPGGYGNAGDGVGTAENVDVTTRDGLGGDGTPSNPTTDNVPNGKDLVTGRWVKVQVPSQPSGTNFIPIGMNGATVVSASLGNISVNSNVFTQFNVTPPSNATAGLRNFFIRVSYSYQ